MTITINHRGAWAQWRLRQCQLFPHLQQITICCWSLMIIKSRTKPWSTLLTIVIVPSSWRWGICWTKDQSLIQVSLFKAWLPSQNFRGLIKYRVSFVAEKRYIENSAKFYARFIFLGFFSWVCDLYRWEKYPFFLEFYFALWFYILFFFSVLYQSVSDFIFFCRVETKC